MNEARDSFETELGALRPLAPSADLRRRLVSYREQHKSIATRWRWGLAVAGSLAAACVMAALIIRHSVHRAATLSVATNTDLQRVGGGDSEPSLQVYQRALAQSPEELDALLSKHARVASEPNPAGVRLCAFTRSDSKLQAILGE